MVNGVVVVVAVAVVVVVAGFCCGKTGKNWKTVVVVAAVA